MTKADLVERVAGKTGLSKSDIAVVVDAFLDAVKHTLEGGHNIEIRGFGTFKVKERKARKARNPRTGEEVPVANRMVPVFKPSNEFKGMITRLPIAGEPGSYLSS
jgi:nucleoid DNA-binding protein